METKLTAESLSQMTGCTVEQAAYCIANRPTDEKRIALARVKAPVARPPIEPFKTARQERNLSDQEMHERMCSRI